MVRVFLEIVVLIVWNILLPRHSHTNLDHNTCTPWSYKSCTVYKFIRFDRLNLNLQTYESWISKSKVKKTKLKLSRQGRRENLKKRPFEINVWRKIEIVGMGFNRGRIHSKMECMEQHVQFLQDGISPTNYKWKIKLVAISTSLLPPFTKLLVVLEELESSVGLSFLFPSLPLLMTLPFSLVIGTNLTTR